MEQIALATIVTTCTMVCYSLLRQTPKMLQHFFKASYQPGITSYICNMHVGQGFCLAIEDAVVLAWHLRRQGFSPQALRRSASALCDHSSKALSLDVALDVAQTLAVKFGSSVGTHAPIGKASLIDVLTCPGHKEKNRKEKNRKEKKRKEKKRKEKKRKEKKRKEKKRKEKKRKEKKGKEKKRKERKGKEKKRKEKKIK